MKFLVVSDSKIKVVLEKSDSKKYGVDYNNADSSKNRRAFFDILAVAKKETGFDIADDKVLIQFYPTSDGGCEVFVTKLGLISGGAAEAINRSHKVTTLSKNCEFFSVDSYDCLRSLCRAIAAVRCPKSEVYRSDSENYYILIESNNSSSAIGEFPFITEFASRVKKDYYTYIKEHYEKIIESDAVKKLSKV